MVDPNRKRGERDSLSRRGDCRTKLKLVILKTFPKLYKNQAKFVHDRIYPRIYYSSSRNNRRHNGTRWNNGNANSNHGFTRRAEHCGRVTVLPQKFCRRRITSFAPFLPIHPSSTLPFHKLVKSIMISTPSFDRGSRQMAAGD